MLLPRLLGVACVLLLVNSSVSAQKDPSARPMNLVEAPLDAAAFAQWSGGAEKPIDPTTTPGGPQSVIWTAKGRIATKGVKYGEGRETGVRHLRLGWQQPISPGSILVRGGGTLSVLKPGATYPGDLAKEEDWLPAERLAGDVVGHSEVSNEGFAIWVLPPQTSTRALRFSHTPAPGDREQAGWLGGIWMLPERVANVAPQALAQSKARDDFSARLNDENNNNLWQAWDNGKEGAALPLSPEHPEIFSLTWTKPVKLSGLCFLWAGFSSVQVEAYKGKPGSDPANATDADWTTVGTKSDLDTLYTLPLGPQWLPFASPLETRALRFRLLSGAKASHPHLKDKVKEGRRTWLGEVLALSPLPQDPLTTLIIPKETEEPPPIPIKFTLREPGMVTLVVEDQKGQRIRNLISETPFPAGENTAWWDGSDDLLRDPEAAKHGLYHIPTRPVAPGTYTVRGLVHPPVQLRYEFSIYNAGKPAWKTEDNTGGWMTTHTPPTSVAIVPGERTSDGKPLVFLGAYVAEGGHGLQWLQEDGTKLGGQGWVGGTWTGAPTLAVDRGKNAILDHLCYVGSVWEGELRLTAKTKSLEDAPIFKMSLGEDPKIRKPADGAKPPSLPGFDGGEKQYVMAGLAAHNGLLVCSMIRQNELRFISIAGVDDPHKFKSAGATMSVNNPRGVAFDSRGALLVLSGNKLIRYPATQPDSEWKDGHLVVTVKNGDAAKVETIIDSGLEDPRQVSTDAAGNFLISDRGAFNQVKVFSPQGKLLKSYGLAGPLTTGAYEPRHMNNPSGFGLDSQGRLWVAEADDHPRRVSVWSPQGELVRAFYGPTEYGGGGVLDPQDPARFYYKGLEFKLDWQAGTDQLARVFSRPDHLLKGHGGHFSPDAPLYPEAQKGVRYFTSCYTQNPTGGNNVAFLWCDDQPVARLVAAAGSAQAWDALKAPEFKSLWPAGTKPEVENPKASEAASFVWTDENGDGRPQTGELKFIKEQTRGVTVMNDLSFVFARHGESTVRLAPTSFSAQKAPLYDLAKTEILGPAGGNPPSSGGNQALAHPDGWTLNTNASAPFSAHSLGGTFKGEPRWSYPSPWPGLHASHEAAVPDRSGMVIGHTRLLGGWVQPPGEGGPLFCVNGNMGNMYLFTADGLFVSTLFHDIRLRPNWGAPVATRNMDVTNVSLHDENFWPSITQVADGRVFLVDGARTSLVRVDGLDGIKRLPPQQITVTTADLERSREWFTRAEAKRQQQRGSGTLTVALRSTAPQVDGKLDDWPATTDWATIDRRGTKANFNSKSQPYDVSAAVAIHGDRLYAAWRSNEETLLNNSGETADALFKTGGCLDLMIGTDPAAPTDRRAPAPGDQRLLVTLVKNKPRAILYRARVPGTSKPVAFSSPSRTIKIDVVEDVTDRVTFATDKAGNYEISLPLSTLQWQPKEGQTIRADLGILRGSNFQTTQRVYWSNKATAITADVPSEAELTPSLWGKWVVKAAP